ncbi:MAG: alpha/beta hydrolase [Candidatus Thorarchaeota archaeon]
MTPEIGGIVRHPSGASVAFLLVHGFCADVDELASLGELLEAQGIASFAMKVAGHGTTPEDLATTTRDDWSRSVSEGLDLVKSWSPEHIFIAGLSMGSALTLLLATRASGIDGIVIFSPAVKVGGIAGKFVPLLKRIMKYRTIDLSYIPKMYDLPRTRYDREPLSAIHELIKLTNEVRGLLPHVKLPTLIIQSGADKTIDPSNGITVFQSISSTVKELHVIENAEHVITCHPTRKDAYPFVLRFIDRITQ